MVMHSSYGCHEFIMGVLLHVDPFTVLAVAWLRNRERIGTVYCGLTIDDFWSNLPALVPGHGMYLQV